MTKELVFAKVAALKKATKLSYRKLAGDLQFHPHTFTKWGKSQNISDRNVRFLSDRIDDYALANIAAMQEILEM